MIKILIFTFSLFLLSCIEKKVGNFAEVKTQGVKTEEEEFIIIGGNERGEFITGGDAVSIIGEFTNRSKFAYTDVEIKISELPISLLKFTPNLEGKNIYPGVGGNCGSTIYPGQTCQIHMTFTPSSTGPLIQTVTINYKDLVDENVISSSLKFFMGESPYLIEINNERDHNFGTIERTLPDNIYTKKVTLKNIGGITARNVLIELSNVDENAYSILENHCPSQLLAAEECDIIVAVSAPNYLPADENSLFTSRLTANYNKNPLNAIRPELGRFGFDFSVYSAKVEGVLGVNGAAGLFFPELIHGNKVESVFQLRNIGSRDLILRSLLVYDSVGSNVAKCRIENATGKLKCFDPVQTHLEKDFINFPFLFQDPNNCFYNYSQADYATSADFIAQSYLITPNLEETPGRTCDVGVTYHSSVANLTDRSFSGWSLGFEYDSTYLDEKVIHSTNRISGASVSIINAEAIVPGKFYVNNYQFANQAYPSGPGPYLFNIGRVTALQTNSTYSDMGMFKLKNTSLKAALKIKEIYTENDLGQKFNIDTTARTINNYFTAVKMAAACKLNSPLIIQNCDLSFNYSPKLPVSTIRNYGKTQVDNGLNFRRFKLVYSDGCTVLDDGITPCPDKEIVFDFTSQIIARGNLQFGGPKQVGASGQVKTQHAPGAIKRTPTGNLMAGERGWQHLWLTNIGSGSISYLKLVSGFDLYTANGFIPFYIIPNTDGLVAGEYDCASFLRGTPQSDSRLPLLPFNSNEVIDFPAGASCRLTIETMMYPNEIAYVDSTIFWNTIFIRGDTQTREHYNLGTVLRNISFEFFDGDLNPPTQTPNFRDGFGERKIINGGATGKWQLRTVFDYPGKLIPKNPNPFSGAVLYRPRLNWDSLVKHPHSQYTSFGNITTIAPQVYNFAIFSGAKISYNVNGAGSFDSPPAFITGIPLAGTKEAFNYLDIGSEVNYALKFNDYAEGISPESDEPVEYVYYAGAFPATLNEVLKFSLQLENRPASGAASLITNITSSIACKQSPTDCEPTRPSIKRGEYLLQHSLGGANVANVDFWLSLENVTNDVGRYESVFTVSMKTPYDRTIKIKVIADIVPADLRSYKIETTDYNCLSSNGTTCDTLEQLGSPVDITDQFLITNSPASIFTMSGVMASPLIKQKKFTITNTGTAPIYDFKLFLKSSPAATALNYSSGLGINITPVPNAYTVGFLQNQYQCQSTANPIKGVLLPGHSCDIMLNFKAVAAAAFPQYVGISHKLLGPSASNDRSGVYVSKYIQGMFEGNNQANLIVFGREFNTKALNYGGKLVYSYPIRFNSYSQNNHPVLSDYPTQIIDSQSLITDPILQIYNQRSEKASFLREYEKFACGGVKGGCVPPNGQLWTTFYQQNGIKLEGRIACFYGADFSNPSIPADQKGFNDNSASTSSPCLVRLTYQADLSKIGEINPQNTLFEVEYYSSQRLVTKKMYMHLEGFIEPYRSIASQNSLVDVYSDPDGNVSLKWDPFVDEISPKGDVIKYRVYYSKKSDDLLKIYEASAPTTLLSADTQGLEYELSFTGLDHSAIYYFRLVAIRQGLTLANQPVTYISVAGNFLRQKVIVPPPGFAFDYKNRNLIERSLSPDPVTKTQAINDCLMDRVRIDDQNIKHTKELRLLSTTVFSQIETEEDALISANGDGSMLTYSDHNYNDFAIWVNEVENLNYVFGASYECSKASQFSIEGDIGYIKSCDNGDPERLCCNINVLNQMRGKPLSGNPNLKVFFTNVPTLTARYRCFANFNDELL